MHKIIRIIVAADSKEEAIANAKQTAEDRLIDTERTRFDYFTTFEKPASEHDTGTSGAGRWGDRPAAARLDSIGGLHELGRALYFTEQQTVEAIERLLPGMKKLVEGDLAPEEFARKKGVFSGEVMYEVNDRAIDPSSFGYYAKRLDSAAAPTEAYLFTSHGETLTSREQFNNHAEYMDETTDYWIVPMDVHY